VEELAALSPRQRSLLDDWLFCHECTDGERDSARVAFQNEEASLDRLLTRVPAAWVDTTRVRLENIAAELSLDSAAAGSYRDHYLGNFVATVQGRSAQLLGDLGTPAALDGLWRALDSASARGYRSDVVEVVTANLLSGARRASPGSVPDSAIEHLDLTALPPEILGTLTTAGPPPGHTQRFRLPATLDLRIQAHAEWTSGSVIQMEWQRCPPNETFLPTITSPPNTNVIEDTRVITGGDCMILGLVKTDSVTPSTVYRLRLSRLP
jgi:hypothetical protein